MKNYQSLREAREAAKELLRTGQAQKVRVTRKRLEYFVEQGNVPMQEGFLFCESHQRAAAGK